MTVTSALRTNAMPPGPALTRQLFVTMEIVVRTTAALPELGACSSQVSGPAMMEILAQLTMCAVEMVARVLQKGVRTLILVRRIGVSRIQVNACMALILPALLLFSS